MLDNSSILSPRSSLLSSRPRWIAFDAVGTLMTPEPSVAIAYQAAGRRYGSRLELEEVRRRFRAAFRRSEACEDRSSATPTFATDERRERLRWTRIVDDVFDDVSDPAGCFQDLWDHFARSKHWRCYPETAAVLERLRRHGYRLAIASNFDGRLHEVCDGLDALAPIERRLVSSELGFRKPGRRFYEAALSRLESPSSEVLMVGDDWMNDVVAARDCGLQTAFLLRPGEAPPDDETARSVARFASLAELADQLCD